VSESLIYFGPYLKPPVGLLPYAQFNNGLPPTVEAIIARHPGFRSLFIDPSALRETVRALKKSGSAQSQLFHHFKKLLVK
jgi:hypothetical protein